MMNTPNEEELYSLWINNENIILYDEICTRAMKLDRPDIREEVERCVKEVSDDLWKNISYGCSCLIEDYKNEELNTCLLLISGSF